MKLITEQCVFTSSDRSMILAVHIDDGLLTGSDTGKLKKFLRELES